MATRTARTVWTGGLHDGNGTVTLADSGLGDYDVSFPRRTAEEADGVTSPEELIAAAHSSCYAMAFSGQVGRVGGTLQSVNVTAAVTLGSDPAGGFKITRILLTVRAQVSGLDEATFQEAATAAKDGCPVSKALAGTAIALDAALV